MKGQGQLTIDRINFMNKHMHRIIMSWMQKNECKSINISAIVMRFTQSHLII